MMENIKFECEICKIFTAGQDSLDSHFLSSTHQLAVHKILVKEKKEKSGVHVSGFSSSVKKEEIHKFFSEYGKITDFYLGPNNSFAIIEYSDADVAQDILTKTITFKEQNLTIKPRVVKASTAKNTSQKQDPAFPKLYEDVKNQRNVDRQLKILVKRLQVHEQYLNPPGYNQVCADLHFILHPHFPDCRVWPFGSTVSGLAFKNSNINIYVDIVPPPNTNSSPETLATIYKRMTRTLLNKSRLFENVVAIPKTKIPVVKAVHKPTRIHCEINFKNMLGVCNSNLIKFLCSLDGRIRPFIFIIKYWARINELSGSGKFSNYAIVMFVIFYLQRNPCAILPPIKMLLGPNTNQVDDWNVNFIYDPCRLPIVENHLRIIHILLNFFKFWASFDYGLNVICPFTGEIVPKSKFAKPEYLSGSFHLYKNNLRFRFKDPLKIETAMCLQDPIELNHNITAHISPRVLDDFRKICEASVNLMNTSAPKDILPKLLLKLDFERGVTINDNSCSFIITSTVAETLSKGDPKNIQKLWFEKINEFLDTVLTKLFLFEVKVSETAQVIKHQKLDGQSDIHDTKIEETVTFHCAGYNNVWEARKSISKNFEMKDSGSVLDHEIAISDYIVNVLCKGLKIKDPIVDFNLTLDCKADPTEAEFVLKNLHRDKTAFHGMVSYFANRIPSLYGRYLKELQKGDTDENTESKTDENEQKKEKVTSETDEIKQESEEGTNGTDKNKQESEEVTMETDDNKQESEEVTMETDENKQENEEVTSETDENKQESEKLTSDSDENE